MTRQMKEAQFYKAQLSNSIRNVVYGHEGLVSYKAILKELNIMVQEVKAKAQHEPEAEVLD